MKVANNVCKFLLIASLVALSGCSKPPVEVVSVKFLSADSGSGNFDRVVELCFKEAITTSYFHKIKILSNENVKITGSGVIRPLASDPNNKCHQRNLYTYIHRDSPVDARQLIKDFIVSGNVKQVLVQVFNEKPSGSELPVSESVFENL